MTNPEEEACLSPTLGGRVYLYPSDDSDLKETFPCPKCRETHPTAQPVAIDRVSTANRGGPHDGDTKFCPNGHVAIWTTGKFTGWRCTLAGDCGWSDDAE